MTAVEVLKKLEVLDIALEVAGDKLRISPPEAISPELLAAIRAHKGELLDLLSREKVDMPVSAVSDMSACPWTRLADSGLGHNNVTDSAQVLFLFACELIMDPTKAREDCQTLPSLWAYYSPFWKERLPQEAFAELERRYRQRLAALGLQDEASPSQGPKPLRPLKMNPEGTGCAECGSPDYWATAKGVRYCLACHSCYFKDAVAVGRLTPKEETRKLSRRKGAA